MTPQEDLFDAIEKGDLSRARDLVDRDPRLASARDDSGLSAVTSARYLGREDILRVLLDKDPELDVFEAAAVGRTERLQELLDDAPGFVGDSSFDGYTPLHLAAFFGHADAVALLLERGADPEVVSHNPMTVQALHSAVAGGRRAVVDLLLAAEVDIDAKQQRGFTPLHQAIAAGNEELTELLLAHGADPTLVNDDGRNALDVAMDSGNERVQALLRRPPQPPPPGG